MGRPDMALFKFVKNILNKEIIEIYNNGNHVRDFTYIDDIVDGIILTVYSNKIFHKKISKKNLTSKKILHQIEVIQSLEYLILEVEKI